MRMSEKKRSGKVGQLQKDYTMHIISYVFYTIISQNLELYLSMSSAANIEIQNGQHMQKLQVRNGPINEWAVSTRSITTAYLSPKQHTHASEIR